MDSKQIFQQEYKKSVAINQGGIHVENPEKDDLLKKVMSANVPPMDMVMQEQKTDTQKGREEDKKGEHEEDNVSRDSYVSAISSEKNKKLNKRGEELIGLNDKLEDDEMEIDLEGMNAQKLEVPMRATNTRLNRYGQLPQMLNRDAIKAGTLLKNAGKVVKKGKFSPAMIDTGRQFINRINKWAVIDENPEGDEGQFYNKLGKKDTVEYLYVDGRPIREFVADQYGYKGSQNKQDERAALAAYAAMIAARQNHPLTLVRPVIINGVADVDIRNVGIDMWNKNGREAKIKGIRYALAGEQYRQYCETAYRSQARAEAGSALRSVKDKDIRALREMEELRKALQNAGKGKHQDYDDFVRTFNTYFDALEFVCLDPEHSDVTLKDLRTLAKLNETAKSAAFSYLKGKKMNLSRHNAVRDIREMLSRHSSNFSRMIKSGAFSEEGATVSLKDILDNKEEGFVVLGLNDEVDQYKEKQSDNADDKNEYDKLDDAAGLSVRQKQILRMKNVIDSDESAKICYKRLLDYINDDKYDDETRLGAGYAFLKAASSALLVDPKYGPQIRKRYAYAAGNTEVLLAVIARDQLTKAYENRFKTIPALQAAMDTWNEQIASQEAEVMSYQSNTLGKNVSEKEFKENGGSSDHRYVSTEEANEIVTASKGFLCAKKVKGHDNLRELKPSLPEYVSLLNGEATQEKVPLRNTFKAMFKTAAYLLFDKKGNIKKDLAKYDFEEIHDTVPGRVDNLFKVGTSQWSRNNAQTFMVDVFLPAMTEMLKEEYKKKKIKNWSDKAEDDAYNYCQAYLKLVENSSGMFIQSPDISFELFQIQSNVIRDTKIDDLMKDPLIADMTIDGTKVTEEEVREAYQETLDQAQKAEEEMKKIRELDFDDEEMCEVNSCIDNTEFNSSIKNQFVENGKEFFEFKYSSLASKDPAGMIEFMKNNFDRLLVYDNDLKDPKEIQRIRDTLDRIETKLNNKERLTANDKDELKSMLTYHFAKYELHRVPQVGKVEKSSYTIETFGASPDTCIQSPLTTKVKIGKYNSDKPPVEDNHEGVNKYYAHDDAFSHISSRKKLIICRLKDIYQKKMVYIQNHAAD